jgi:uncharacterized PurR-regulated membrane protein YhhQ (DUF165 family)
MMVVCWAMPTKVASNMTIPRMLIIMGIALCVWGVFYWIFTFVGMEACRANGGAGFCAGVVYGILCSLKILKSDKGTE